MSYILRGKGMGKDSMPEIGKLLDIPVYTSEDKITGDHDYAFRWGCTAKTIEVGKVINKAAAIEETSNKKTFRGKLRAAGLAPDFWDSFGDYLKFRDALSDTEKPTHELLVRPAYHQRSESIYRCTGLYELFKACSEVKEPYISEYIKKEREFRVFVCSNRVLWVIEKLPKNKSEVSWGCVSTGNFKCVDWSEWPSSVVSCALASMNESDLDFGAVDIITRTVQKMSGTVMDAMALEINTACYLSPYYSKCIAKAWKYILKNGREHFPDPVSYDWKNVIHPAATKDLSNV